jgi:3-hydroxybutyryl-CoA dehydrogenase
MRLGIAGAGTMGAGIAAAARDAGVDVVLHDPDPAARGRVEGVAWAEGLEGLAGCDVVVEAAPEDLAVKRRLFGALAAVVAPDAVLATNTSSLLVSAIAAGVPGPERVVGLHFFNPVPRMRLVELVAGAATVPAALARARTLGEAMGKHVIEVADGPGFLVNRCNRPFSLEPLRIVQERLATPEQVDRICRRALGFRMGPFELMDLVGTDVGHAIARSFHDQTHEPRWRPSPLAARMAASGRLGRKTGQGWYAYPPGRPPDPDPAAPGGGDGLVVVAGESELAAALLAAADEAGWDAAEPAEAEGELPALIVDCGATEEDPPLQGGPQLLLCDAAPLAALDPGGTAAGFVLAQPLRDGGPAELTRTATTAPAAAAAAERFFATLGRPVEWVGDAPGLVSGRLLAALVNEACFALGEGVGSAADIDAGMELGLNHPRGPLGWGDLLGPAAVLETLLGLWEEFREERYRPAPALVRAVRAEQPLSAR